MYRIFEFLYRYRAFLCFALLEVLCAWLIVSYNSYQGASFFNTSNYYAAQVLNMRSGIAAYFNLQEVNRQLASQNADLLKKISLLKERNPDLSDTEALKFRDEQYSYIPARVVKNTTRFPENYLTLNKGTLDGVKADMGVIGPNGLVGRVKTVSKHFSTVVSILHSGMNVASKIKNKNIDATVVWDGIDPTEGKLLHVVRHHKINKGDSIVTSEYNAVFPPNVLIGTIKDFSLGESSSDYNIEMNFSTDFTSLSYVYVIQNKLKAERDSLENTLE